MKAIAYADWSVPGASGAAAIRRVFSATFSFLHTDGVHDEEQEIAMLLLVVDFVGLCEN